MPKQKSLPRSIIIFDGSNFYHKLKELDIVKPKTFNYSAFSSFITKGTELKTKYFCIGRIKASQHDVHARKMMADQQAFATKLQQDSFIIQFGYLLKSDGKYHEKGTDIQIATDLLDDGFNDRYDVCYLVTSDSDLIPAISKIQSAGKKIVYVGFRHKISYALKLECASHILLTKSDILQFI